jgi:hypothetical protein
MSPASLPLGSDEFVQGMVPYADFDGTQQHTRIIIPVTFGNMTFTTAIVDTGAPWCVLRPEETYGLNVNVFENLGDETLIIRGGAYTGKLYRMPVSLEADAGAGLTVEAKVFIPILEQGQVYSLPNFVGFEGFLELIRFAVDPGQNLFYFGSLV